MTISGIGTSNYYTGQMSAMWSRSGSAGMSGKMTQGGPMGAPPNPSEIFDKVDIDNSGGLDEAEFQALADKISEATGEEVDVAELFATYDEDGDGVLSDAETHTAMEANRPEGPPPGGMMGGMGGMQGPPPPDPLQIFNDADEDQSGSLDETEAELLADMISQATDEEVDVSELFATHDADQDGVLSEEESMAALEANRPDGPPPGGMMAQGQREMSTSAGIAKYMQMASLGMEQDQYANMFAMSGGNSASFGSDGLFA